MNATTRHLPTTQTAITAVAADRGSIAGFEAVCGACGFRFTTAFEATARADAREHVAYMIRKEGTTPMR